MDKIRFKEGDDTKCDKDMRNLGDSAIAGGMAQTFWEIVWLFSLKLNMWNMCPTLPLSWFV